MSINTDNENIEIMFHPTQKVKRLSIPSELLLDTIDLLMNMAVGSNEFRYTIYESIVTYCKVSTLRSWSTCFSDSTSTMIEQVWGDERVFRYKQTLLYT